MREININCIMEQLGFSSSQMDNWQGAQSRAAKKNVEFTIAPMVSKTDQSLIHVTTASEIDDSFFISC